MFGYGANNKYNLLEFIVKRGQQTYILKHSNELGDCNLTTHKLMWWLGATKNLTNLLPLTIHLLPYPQGDFGRNTYNRDMMYHSNSVSWILIISFVRMSNFSPKKYFFKDFFCVWRKIKNILKYLGLFSLSTWKSSKLINYSTDMCWRRPCATRTHTSWYKKSNYFVLWGVGGVGFQNALVKLIYIYCSLKLVSRRPRQMLVLDNLAWLVIYTRQIALASSPKCHLLLE
jgi:hypothetical protein